MSMSDDPERLADASSNSPMAELFASAARDLPSEQQLSRLAAQLGPLWDGPPLSPPAPSGTPALLKLGVAAGALALLVGGALTLRGGSPALPVSPAITKTAAAPVPVTAPAVEPLAPVSAPAPEVPSAASAASAPARAADAPSANSKSPAVQNKTLSEAALLEQARRALNSSPSYALTLANQHRARFPNGVLTQEREVIAIEALRRLHRESDANQRATGFSKAFPGSAHQRMVDETAPK